MSKKFSWLHLADLHLTPAVSWDSNFVLQRLLADVDMLRHEHDIQPDAIFISGDLSFSGKIEEFKIAQEFINKLSDVSGVKKEGCFFVPGNHDIDRSQVSIAGMALRDKVLNEGQDRILVELESEISTQHLLFAPLANYANFTPSHCNIKADRIFYTATISKPELPVNITILGLNSAWFSFDDRPAIVGRPQVQKAIEGIDEDSFVIALMHHPLSSLPEWDQEFISDIIDHHCDVLLRGHLHRTRLENLGPSPYRCSRIAAGGTYTGGRAQNGYNAVVADFEEGTITTYLRHYRPDGGGVWVEDNIFRDPKPGQFKWHLPNRFSSLLHKKTKRQKPEPPESSIIWIHIVALVHGDDIDVAESLEFLSTLIGVTDIELKNVQSGSLWLNIKIPREGYLQMLELYAAQDERLSSLGGKYRIKFIGPEKPKIEKGQLTEDKPLYRKVRVFVASPGDVAEERDCLAQVIQELNKNIADDKGMVLELIRWETDALPSMGRPQEIINKEIKNIDILIGILSSRFGTPTGVAGSGTEEEFNLAYDSWSRFGRPQILFYFKRSGMVFNSREQLDQMRKVLEFRDKLGKRALFSEFDSVQTFQTQIRQHLSKLIVQNTGDNGVRH